MQRNNRQTTRPTKSINPKKARLRELNKALLENGTAIAEGPKRKTWSIHDVRTVRPITQAQRDMFSAYMGGYDICGYGCAGTGKSFVALYLALLDVLNPNTETKRIIIVKSIASVRDPGALPGTLEEKVAPHELPYQNLLHELVGKYSTYQDMKDAGVIEFHSSSFLRGVTWNDTVVVLDECQNMTFPEIDSVMTRVGKNSKVFVLGDIKQNDLINSRKEVSGFAEALKTGENMEEFSMVRFTVHDIVRSGFCKSWIMAVEELNS
jgi:phosphate starvation-inducible PhoH-like protein